ILIDFEVDRVWRFIAKRDDTLRAGMRWSSHQELPKVSRTIARSAKPNFELSPPIQQGTPLVPAVDIFSGSRLATSALSTYSGPRTTCFCRNPLILFSSQWRRRRTHDPHSTSAASSAYRAPFWGR